MTANDVVNLLWNAKDLSDLLRSATPKTLVQFYNCQTLRDHQLVAEDLWIRDGKIQNPEPIFFDERCLPDIRVDCGGLIIAAGFIDIQINGGFGFDFSSVEDLENFDKNLDNFSHALLQYGVTSFCPTLISSKPDVYRKVLPRLVKRDGSHSRGAGCLGAHIEGPFLSLAKKGAHPAANVCTTIEEGALETMYGAENLRDVVVLTTLAPELPGALAAIERLTTKYNITVSLGHSKANIVDGEKGICAGASCITHIFNAMENYHHRDPGLIGLLTSKYLPTDRQLYYGIISDGIHTHDSALRIAHKTHPEGLVLITDAITALGLGDGIHRLGDSVVEVRGIKAVLTNEATVAGSVSSMDACVRHLVKAARCDTVEALECASLHAAQLLGITARKGSLDFATDADFVLLDAGLHVQATFVAGCMAWARTD